VEKEGIGTVDEDLWW